MHLNWQFEILCRTTKPLRISSCQEYSIIGFGHQYYVFSLSNECMSVISATKGKINRSVKIVYEMRHCIGLHHAYLNKKNSLPHHNWINNTYNNCLYLLQAVALVSIDSHSGSVKVLYFIRCNIYHSCSNRRFACSVATLNKIENA